MPEPSFPEGPKPIPSKNVLPPTPEIAQNLKEPKLFSVTVDGEQRFYPETWPHAYIPDGPLAKLGGGLGSGSIPDKETQIKVLQEITSPSQEIFAAYDRHDDTLAPDWFTKTLAPVMVDVGLSLERFRQPNQKSIGSDWAAAVDRMMDYDGYPKEIGEKAARAIGQLEGPTTTRSAFMRYLYRHDWQAFEKMLAFLLQEETPDSFTLATYVAKDAFEEDLNFDNMVSSGPDGKPNLDQDKMGQAINSAQRDLQAGFNAPTGYDALVKVLSTKKYQQYQQGHGNLWQGIKPQEEMPAPGISLYEKLADGSFTVDNLGRIVVQAPKAPTDEEAHKQLDQATKAARYAGVDQPPTDVNKEAPEAYTGPVFKEKLPPTPWWKRPFVKNASSAQKPFFTQKEMKSILGGAKDYLAFLEGFQKKYGFLPDDPQSVTLQPFSRWSREYRDPNVPQFLKEGTPEYLLRQTFTGNTRAEVQVRKQIERANIPRRKNSEVSATENTDYYEKAMVPAMQRVITSGLRKYAFEFTPSSPDQPIYKDGLDAGLLMFWHTGIPTSLLQRAQERFGNNQTVTLGQLLGEIADISPQTLEVNLATLMVAGSEGFSLARAIARKVYKKDSSDDRFSSPSESGLTQKDIVLGLTRLLDFPLPESAVRHAASLVQTENRFPTIGEILKGFNPVDNENLLVALDSGEVARMIGTAAWGQTQKI